MTSIKPNFNDRTMITPKNSRRPDPVGHQDEQDPQHYGDRQGRQLTMFCPGYSHGRCGIHLTSCSLPAAIKLPVNVRYPRMISTMMAVIRKVVSLGVPSSPTSRILGRPHQPRRQTAERVRQGGSLRDRGQRDAREAHADTDGREDRHDDPQLADPRPGPGRDHGQEHRRDAGEDATAGRLRIVHPMKGEDEQHRGDEVGELEWRISFLTSSRVLNILSIRSVIRNPLTMFVIEANSATAPRIWMSVG